MPVAGGKYKPWNYRNISSVRTDRLHGSQRFFVERYNQMTSGSDNSGDLLLFIHGFNCGYQNFCENLDTFYNDYVKPGSNISQVVGFTWPSNSKLFDYKDDRTDAKQAAIAFDRGYNKLLRFFRHFFATKENEPCDRNIHLICHSMGNQVFENFVADMIDQYGLREMFKEVIMAAPDVSYLAFEPGKPLYRIRELCERVHVYTHSKDRALGISRYTKNFEKRLGNNGPANFGRVPDNISFIDCTNVSDQSGIGNNLIDHSYFQQSPSVTKDIGEVLNGKTPNRQQGQFSNQFTLG